MSAGWRLESAAYDGDVFEAAREGDAIVNVLGSNNSLLIGCGGVDGVFCVQRDGARLVGTLSLPSVPDLEVHLSGIRDGSLINTGAIAGRHLSATCVSSRHIADSNVLPQHISDIDLLAPYITTTDTWEQQVVAAQLQQQQQFQQQLDDLVV
jgi:hypothetical protein